MKNTFYDSTKSLEESQSALILSFRALLLFARLSGKGISLEELVQYILKIALPTIWKLTKEEFKHV